MRIARLGQRDSGSGRCGCLRVSRTCRRDNAAAPGPTRTFRSPPTRGPLASSPPPFDQSGYGRRAAAGGARWSCGAEGGGMLCGAVWGCGVCVSVCLCVCSPGLQWRYYPSAPPSPGPHRGRDRPPRRGSRWRAAALQTPTRHPRRHSCVPARTRPPPRPPPLLSTTTGRAQTIMAV